MKNQVKNMKIVVVEDDLYYNRVLSKYIASICNEGRYPGVRFQIRSFLTAKTCLADLDRDTDIMVLDYYLSHDDQPYNLTGEDILDEVKLHCPNCEVIMISSQKDVVKTAQLLRKGIYEYVDKNVNTGNRIGQLLHEIIRNQASQ